MPSFWKVVNAVIRDADVILLVLDARFVEESRHKEIELKVEREGKPLIYVINKCDLVPKSLMEKHKRKLKNCVFVSSVKHFGTVLLRHKILSTIHKKPVVVGVLGYPNTGKSSIISALKGKQAARVSNVSGTTRGKQIISSSGLKLIDTPGVIPFEEKDEIKHALLASVNPEQIKDPETVACTIIELFDVLYDVHVNKSDSFETLEEIALKKGKLIKGGDPDTITMARILIKDFQTGKIIVPSIDDLEESDLIDPSSDIEYELPSK